MEVAVLVASILVHWLPQLGQAGGAGGAAGLDGEEGEEGDEEAKKRKKNQMPLLLKRIISNNKVIQNQNYTVE